jgi:hypothetical protein
VDFGSSPLRASQGLPFRPVIPIRPDLSTDDPALGANQPPIQVKEHGLVGPAIDIDDRAVVAVQSGGAVDQQSPDPMLADIAERDRRAAVGLGPSLRRRIVVGIAMERQARLPTQRGRAVMDPARGPGAGLALRSMSRCERDIACWPERGLPRRDSWVTVPL